MLNRSARSFKCTRLYFEYSLVFTLSFFISLGYTAYSFYNFVVYGSCEPIGTCYLTPIIGWCILLIEKLSLYAVLLIMISIEVYLLIRRLRKQSHICML